MAKSPAPIDSNDSLRSGARPWTVYILKCADGSLYTGITVDLARRMRQHNQGKASRYTRSRLPVRLVHQETQPNHGSALRREAAIKKLNRQAKWLLVCRG